MTDRYDEMRVPPDPSLAEELRQRLHARMARLSWDDHEGRSHLHLDAARLDPEQHFVPVKEDYVSVDSPPTSEVRTRRRLALAAAAVVAVIGVAAIAINSMNSDDDVEPSPAAATTVAPTTVAPPRRREGTFDVEGAHGTITVPDGWTEIRYGVIKRGPPPFGVIFGFLDDTYYTSMCRDVPVGPTVDDLVSAWANLPGVDATAARDVTIDGFKGKQIEFTVPDYEAGDCNGMFFRCGWSSPQRAAYCGSMIRHKDVTGGPPYHIQALPNQHQKVLILDIDGARLMIMAGYFPDSSQQDRAAIDEILASIQIG